MAHRAKSFVVCAQPTSTTRKGGGIEMRKLYLVIGLLLVAGLALTACGGQKVTLSEAKSACPHGIESYDSKTGAFECAPAPAATEETAEQNTEALEEKIEELTETIAEMETDQTTETDEGKDDEETDTECKVLTTADVKELTGVDVQRVDTEPATWTWRAVDLASTPATCPVGFVCTVDLGGKVLVYEGRANTGIVAGTFRHVCEFDPGDAVTKPCALLAKEQEFGASETPSFEVAAGNFECSN